MDSKKLSKYLGGKHIGINTEIKSFGDILANPNETLNTLFWIKKKYISKANFNDFLGIIISDTIIPHDFSQIIVKNPRLSFSKAVNLIHSDKNELKGQNLYNAGIIGDKCKFGNNVNIESNVIIGNNVIIGHNSVICHGTIIEDNVIIGNNTTIGGHGFGFEKNKEGMYEKIKHIGNVKICSNSWIGDNVTIDKSTIGTTLISNNVKIDNQVHIAHNCAIGSNTIITAGVTLSGGVKIGSENWIGPNSTIIQKITTTSNVFIAINSLILKNIKSSGTYFGVPAKKIS